jgi:hypothetical protein
MATATAKTEETVEVDDTVEVYMTTPLSGTRNGAPWPPIGEKATLPAPEAAHLVAAGHASVEAPETR